MSTPRPRNNTATNSTQQATSGQTEARPIRYVVVRDGHRVSDKEYDLPTDAKCLAEIKFWTAIATRQSYGEAVEAVPYDSKRHRVW